VTTTGISATNAAGSGASISVANSYLALNYMIKVA
jgi:hypothetical protein